jgi:hypothetical protein
MVLSLDHVIRRIRINLTYALNTGGHESVQLVVIDMFAQ